MQPSAAVTSPRPVKDGFYFEHPRPDVLELVSASARRVLDIGCGAGRLGSQIRERQRAEVVGIELNARAATVARQRLNEVLQVDVEDPATDFPARRFDCVICADVLEHLREPSLVLQKIRRWLTPDGSLVISIPNVRYHSVVLGLLSGNWTYESAGLLDADHVRFFTRREIEKLLYRQGFAISEYRAKPGPGYAEWNNNGRPGAVQIGQLRLAGLAPTEAEEFYIYQYLLVARPDPEAWIELPLIDQSEPLARLAQSHPWPLDKPRVRLPEENLGGFNAGAQEMLRKSVRPQMRVIVELGAWLGLSTRFIADHAANATVITIGHGEGSPEHRSRADMADILPSLYETFQAMNWEYRDRILPLRCPSQEGLNRVHAAGVNPDLIFVDADQTYAAVRADLETASRLFPEAELAGDDYDAPDVYRAVHEFAAQHHLTVEASSVSCGGWRLVRPEQPQRSHLGRDPGLTSIILVTFNQLAFTRECIDSIRLRTDEPYELICVDNGSTDGTPEYLQSLAAAGAFAGRRGTRVILNPDNRGFPKGVNQGIQLARGRQVLLLNNDTVVTTGWLRRMLDALASTPEAGLVGPCSNYVSGPQRVAACYPNISSLDGFAWDWGRQYAGKRQEVDRLVGFCLLIRRTVIDKIGLLDERFGIGCYEDDDYCRRALQAGFRCLIAVDSFVHHYGNRTFAGSGIDFRKVLSENQRKFEEKWQLPLNRAGEVPLNGESQQQPPSPDPASNET